MPPDYTNVPQDKLLRLREKNRVRELGGGTGLPEETQILNESHKKFAPSFDGDAVDFIMQGTPTRALVSSNKYW
jgi:hypothetical protein